MAIICALFTLLLLPSDAIREVGQVGRLNRLNRLEPDDPRAWVLQRIGKKSRLASRDVGVSAMRFCQKLAEYARDNSPASATDDGVLVKLIVDKLNGAQKRCQAALTHANDNFTMNWGGESPPHDTHGRVDRFTSSLHWSLTKVCSDECEELVRQMEKEAAGVASDMMKRGEPSHEVCAKRVVREVEAEILGCCGRTCGWDEAASTCRLWPLLDNNTQALWQEECCSEYTILNGSKRQVMCDSVLNRIQKQQADQDDPKQQEPGDDKLVGQSLLQLQNGEMCRDGSFLSSVNNCPPVLKELPDITCAGLKGWKSIRRRNARNTREAESCQYVNGAGECANLTSQHGSLFEVESDKVKCCPLKAWSQTWEMARDATETNLWELLRTRVLVWKK